MSQRGDLTHHFGKAISTLNHFHCILCEDTPLRTWVSSITQALSREPATVACSVQPPRLELDVVLVDAVGNVAQMTEIDTSPVFDIGPVNPISLTVFRVQVSAMETVVSDVRPLKGLVLRSHLLANDHVMSVAGLKTDY